MDRLKAATAALDAATAACEAAGAGGGGRRRRSSPRSTMRSAPSRRRAASTPKRASRVLDGLGFAPDDQQRPCSAFSGGWQMPIALARMPALEAGPLLLDEPSNHLDASARRGSSDLREYAGSVVLVSTTRRCSTTSSASPRWRAAGCTRTRAGTRAAEQRDARAAEAAATLDKQRRQAEKLQGFVDKWGAQATSAPRPTRGRRRWRS